MANIQKYFIADFLGKTFGATLITGEVFRFSPKGKLLREFSYKCKCGKIGKAFPYDIASGKIVSCGCEKANRVLILSETRVTHGDSTTNTRFYDCYRQMIRRCLSPSDTSYTEYGGRGITVCQEWLDDYQTFKQDMFSTYSEELTIDRIDNNLGYYKENCKWSTPTDQNHNRRKFRGKSSSMIGISKLVSKYTGRVTFTAKIQRGHSNSHIGTFSSETLAAFAYDNASEEIYGDRPNKTTRNEDGSIGFRE